MSSPFPGVDPYLESQGYWPDFHSRFINYWCEALAEKLPENYEARIGERVNLVELPEDRVKRISPDVALSRVSTSGGTALATAGVATLEPITVPLLIEEETRETYIEILQRPGRELVGVLELLSPSNKEEPGRSSYLARRNTLLNHEVHLVELDFLLRGQRLPFLRDLPAGHYFAFVARADQRPDCEVFAWTVRDALPSIPIPLKKPDGDLWLSLGSVFSLAFERGRYSRSIDYAEATHLPFNDDDHAWIQSQARKR